MIEDVVEPKCATSDGGKSFMQFFFLVDFGLLLVMLRQEHIVLIFCKHFEGHAKHVLYINFCAIIIVKHNQLKHKSLSIDILNETGTEAKIW